MDRQLTDALALAHAANDADERRHALDRLQVLTASGARLPSMISAVQYGHRESVLEFAVKHHRDFLGHTALHYAATLNREKVVRWLVEAEDVDATDRRGYTALHYAVKFPGVVRILVKHMRTDTLERQDLRNGRTALHNACDFFEDQLDEQLVDSLGYDLGTSFERYLDTLNILLAHMRIEARDRRTLRGQTALHFAAARRDSRFVDVLVQKLSFSALYAKDATGRTALDVARRHGRIENMARIEAELERGHRAASVIQAAVLRRLYRPGGAMFRKDLLAIFNLVDGFGPEEPR